MIAAIATSHDSAMNIAEATVGTPSARPRCSRRVTSARQTDAATRASSKAGVKTTGMGASRTRREGSHALRPDSHLRHDVNPPTLDVS